MELENKKTRSARCSATQFNEMIDFMIENKLMIAGKLTPEQHKLVENKWRELTILLNGKKGANKTPDQWKKVIK